MRRSFAFICLVLLLLATGGRALLFRLQLAEVRQEARAVLAKGLEPDKVETIRLNKADSAAIHWLEEGLEFEWRDERYDVLSKKHEGGLFVLHVLPDKKESALVADFQKEERSRNTSSHMLIRLLAAPYLAPVSVCLATLPVCTTSVFPELESGFPGRHFPVLTPPPQVCFAA
jgi:hypothetical protein